MVKYLVCIDGSDFSKKVRFRAFSLLNSIEGSDPISECCQ